jgi:hypothetical protein
MTAEKPILFSGPMVPPVLDGRKTQTRRVIKPQPYEEGGLMVFPGSKVPEHVCTSSPAPHCPYGQPGDGLWVKETWRTCAGGWVPGVRYEADGDEKFPEFSDLDKLPNDWRNYDRKRPSIYMPRWASRIDLDLLDVRVERVQDISASDAQGCYSYGPNGEPDDPREDFRELWDSINAAPRPVKVGGRLDHYVSYPWEAIHETRTHRGLPWLVQGNPWVWALTFKRKGA